MFSNLIESISWWSLKILNLYSGCLLNRIIVKLTLPSHTNQIIESAPQYLFQTSSDYLQADLNTHKVPREFNTSLSRKYWYLDLSDAKFYVLLVRLKQPTTQGQSWYESSTLDGTKFLLDIYTFYIIQFCVNLHSKGWLYDTTEQTFFQILLLS